MTIALVVSIIDRSDNFLFAVFFFFQVISEQEPLGQITGVKIQNGNGS